MTDMIPCKKRFPIVAVVGPSGCGKTTVMFAAAERMADKVAIIRTVTTREPREPEDHDVYTFVTDEQFDGFIEANTLAQYSGYVRGTRYGNLHEDMRVLDDRIGLLALVEESVPKFIEAGYRVLVVRMIPLYSPGRDDEDRKQADQKRAKLPIRIDAVLRNDFRDGKEVTILEFLAYLEAVYREHT